MITNKNEAKTMTKHISCDKTCQRECKNYCKCRKDYSWNPYWRAMERGVPLYHPHPTWQKSPQSTPPLSHQKLIPSTK